MGKSYTPAAPAKSARAAGLRYVSDAESGIERRRTVKGFAYLAPDGAVLRDRATLKRIRALAVPPAWTEVGICPRADGHLQATGRDARRRKQYRYHDRWREGRDETKYGRLAAFARALPRIRRRVAHDLALPGLPREKALATVVRLLETTFVRIGNAEYARENESFGLTTLRERQARVNGSTLRLRFKGKSGMPHELRSPTAASRESYAACRICLARNCSNTSMTMGARMRSNPPTSTRISGRSPGPNSRARTSARGPGRFFACARCAACRHRHRRPADVAKWLRRSRPPRMSFATRARYAASATSTLLSSKLTSMEVWRGRCVIAPTRLRFLRYLSASRAGARPRSLPRWPDPSVPQASDSSPRQAMRKPMLCFLLAACACSTWAEGPGKPHSHDAGSAAACAGAARAGAASGPGASPRIGGGTPR